MTLIWLNEDLYSFQEGLLRFLDIRDVTALGCVNREHSRVVARACRDCKHLERVNSSDLSTITNCSLFPQLEGFSQICIGSFMCTKDMSLLVDRWTTWHTCHVSTRMHSRRAIGKLLLKVKALTHLSLDLQTLSDDMSRQLQTPLHGFIRRNRQLGSLSVRGRVTSLILKPFRLSSISSIRIDGDAVSSHELCRIVGNLPQSLKKFVYRGRIGEPPASAPFFLLTLIHRPKLQQIVCLNYACICSVTCSAWAVVENFCENTRVSSLTMDLLRVDMVVRLAQRGFVRHLRCGVVGCTVEEFKHLNGLVPQSFILHHVDCMPLTGSCA